VKVLLGLAKITQAARLEFSQLRRRRTARAGVGAADGSARVTVSRLGNRAEFTWSDFKRVAPAATNARTSSRARRAADRQRAARLALRGAGPEHREVGRLHCMRFPLLCLLLCAFAGRPWCGGPGRQRRAARHGRGDSHCSTLRSTRPPTICAAGLPEHRLVRVQKGRVKTDVVIRHDPSRPYAEQWTPITIEGREPTERERSKYRRQGERAAPGARPASPRDRRPALGEVIDVGRRRSPRTTATQLVFEIPLNKFGNERFPPEKFQVQRADQQGERSGSRTSRAAARIVSARKLVVKVKSARGASILRRWTRVIRRRWSRSRANAAASVLFVSVGGSVELRRTELKHVKPFDERSRSRSQLEGD